MQSRLAFLLVVTVILAAPSPAAAWSPGQQTSDQVHSIVEVNGISMAYRDIGQGAPLVLLHGFMGTGAQWDAVLGEFTGHHRVIVPDLRGHGRSTNPAGAFTHRQAARDVFALLDHLGIDRFSGMGASTGAMTLLHMATDQPERVEAMVLMAGTNYFPQQAREIMRGVDPDAVAAEQLEESAQQQGHVRGGEQLRALMGQFRDFQDSYDDMNFTSPYLSTITARTLIVHGDRDAFFPVSIPVGIYEAIPNAYLWIVPNAGHSFMAQPGRWRRSLVATVLDFLANWEGRSGA